MVTKTMHWARYSYGLCYLALSGYTSVSLAQSDASSPSAVIAASDSISTATADTSAASAPPPAPRRLPPLPARCRKWW